MSPPLREFRFVDTRAALQDVVRYVTDANLLALDTEFVRERTYYPKLCVLQIATGDMLAAVDCLADIELDALFAALAHGDTKWILHSARQDLEVLVPRTGRLPAELIDTQIGAAMLGFPLQVGLQGLLSELLGVTLGKEHTRTDWSRRPLPGPAIEYALDDVRYLQSAWETIDARLSANGRRPWFDEDCQRQLNLPLEPSDETILERTKGAGGLKSQQRGAALALVGWREQRARQRDKPRRWILEDDQLVRIAAARPERLADLKRLEGLPKSLVERSGNAMLVALAGASSAPDTGRPVMADKQLLKTLQERVRQIADNLGVPPELLATRRDLAAVAVGQVPDVFRSGWRGDVLGDMIRELSPASA